jgi:osmoprotectant transport system substrate-binding protein
MRQYLGKFFIASICLALVWAMALAGPAGAADRKLVVGGKNFTEQYILADLAKQLLEKNGFSVELKTGVGSAVAWRSLENDQIDLYYEYTGTAYTVFHKQKDLAVMTDPQKVYNWVKEQDAKNGLVWLDPLPFNNTYTVMMRAANAKKLGIKTISDFAAYNNKNAGALSFALDAEFWERPDGFKKLMKVYGFRMPAEAIKKMGPGLCYMALQNNQVNAAMGFATDGRIAAFGFINLEDDKQFFPVYNPVPVARQQVLEKYPAIKDILQPLAAKLTTEKMQQLNKAVDVDHQEVSKVAADFLKKEGLL